MAESMIVVFKLRTATEDLIGPTLINYIKILPADQSQGSAKRSSEAELIVIGQALSEQGYGELRRCLNVIDTLEGDIDEAKKILTQISQAEN